MLRPLDGVVPYRLEMQAKMGNHRQRPSLGLLYEFWGSALADALFEEDPFILNLASKEYSNAYPDICGRISGLLPVSCRADR